MCRHQRNIFWPHNAQSRQENTRSSRFPMIPAIYGVLIMDWIHMINFLPIASLLR